MSSEIPIELKEMPYVPKWYFGGVASAFAACFTHPLDTMKVYYQVSGSLKQQNLIKATINVVKNNGFLSLYNGLSASVLRQLTYSTVRFAIYEIIKQKRTGQDMTMIPLYERTFIAAVAGAAGGFVGTPADLVNVRMQSDLKLEKKCRRNYRNALQGLIEIYSREGFWSLYRGSSMVMLRSVLVTIGQLAMYDQFKYWLVEKASLKSDSISTHIICSMGATLTCVGMVQPMDVIKTRLMFSEGKSSLFKVIIELYRSSGLMGFYKGFTPTLIRVGPHTILVFIFFEQLRMNFGSPAFG